MAAYLSRKATHVSVRPSSSAPVAASATTVWDPAYGEGLTDHQSRMLKRSYLVYSMLEHMYGLGNAECIKKAIELYFRE